MNTDVSGEASAGVLLIGTGTMGTAFAGAILAAGRSLTVWNRTPERAAPLGRAGATIAADVARAVNEARTVLVCVSNQAAASAVLDDDAIRSGLRGKDLVQLTTGTPADGRRGARWAAEHGISYLDVAIMAYPRDIGTSAAVLLCAGDKPSFARLAELFDAMGSARYLGDDAGAPALLDAALIGFFYGSITGYIHGLALVEAERGDVSQYAELARPFLAGFVTNAITETAERALAGNFAAPQSSMDTHLGGIDLLVVGASREAGIRTDVMEAIRESFLAAIEAGRGADDIAALTQLWTARDDGSGAGAGYTR